MINLKDKRDLWLILIISILLLSLLFIILPDFWFAYLFFGLGLGLFVERKIRNRVILEYEKERELQQLKENLKNKRISDNDLIKFSNGSKEARLAIANGLGENFDKFSVSARIIERFSEDKDEEVRDAALYVFQQNFFKFLSPGDVFKKFLDADNNYSCDYAMKLIDIMEDHFEKIEYDVMERAIICIAKGDLKITSSDPADVIGKSALGMLTDAVDVKKRLAKFICMYFNRIRNKTTAIDLLLEWVLRIKPEDEERYADFIVSVGVCLKKCNTSEYKKIGNAQDFVERFSRSMNEEIAKIIVRITEKNFEHTKNLATILKNLAYSQSDEVKAIVRKILRKDMQDYDKILKILET